MPHYYNEFDPFAANWLRNLIAKGLIPAGDVDERSIVDVRPDDLRGYVQCHFFAGIGGWPYALRLAGFPDDRSAWTGSCPCQPLSSAGQRKGHADERHLWPAFFGLIDQRRPATIFGEQVASIDGREWFAGIRSDLEDAGYACGGADLCAAGVGAPHIRQRLFWVADRSQCGRGEERQDAPRVASGNRAQGLAARPLPSGADDGLAHAERNPRGARRLADEPRGRHAPQDAGAPTEPGRRRATRGMDDTTSARHEPARIGEPAEQERRRGVLSMGREDNRLADANGRIESDGPIQRSGQHGFWQEDTIAIPCTDGRTRRAPAEPSFQPLAYGVPGRLGQLRAYGNAIVPQVGAVFIEAFLESTP